LSGSLRPPNAALKHEDARPKAIKDSIRNENEVRSAQTEAKKRVAIDEGETVANSAPLASSEPKLPEWGGWKFRKDAIGIRNSVMPSVMRDSGGAILFNIPVKRTGAPVAKH